MPTRMTLPRTTFGCVTLAAAAFVLSTPATAACLQDGTAAQCDVFLDEYRSDEVPVGTAMVERQRPFLMENYDLPGTGVGIDDQSLEDVLYWDGETAFVLPEDSGAQIKIADW